VLLLALATVSAQPKPAQPKPAPPPDYSAAGLQALEAQKYDAAVEAFTRAIAADPKDYFAHFNLGLAYTFLHKDAEGVAEYRKTLELKPGLYEAELNAGILLMRQKNPAEAAPLLAQAVEQKPKEFRPRVYLAQALLTTGDNAKAQGHFATAAELDPKSAAAQLGLAQSLARQDRLEQAAPHFRQAAQLDPSYQDALLELAALYEKAKQPAEAIAIYQQFPGNPVAAERLGELLLETKRYGEAIPRLEEAYTKDPTAANRVALAAAYLFNKQIDKALPLLEKSVNDDPRNYDLRLMYARALRDVKQYPPSARQFYEATRLRPDARETWNDLAGMLYLTGNLESALAAFDRSHQLGDDSAANWYFHAIIQDKLQQYKPALESYRRFLALSQDQRPDEEFKARQRIKVIQKELSKR
jgi:tetratricopeptide (TPR) repeat protein